MQDLSPIFLAFHSCIVTTCMCACMYMYWSSTVFVHKYLYTMLESHNLLQDYYFNFCRKRSTISLLMTAVHDWAVGLNFNQTTHCLFLDMSKAFDSIPHNSAPKFLKCLTRQDRPAHLVS